ncbi:MAG: threonine aldolase family protein [Phycisphaerales bacterium]|nr:threonine aldolase family protein [Phycisphaerales bacterium]
MPQQAAPTTPLIDLRSDTVTQPTDAMRRAMFAAPLGDDVLGDDPSVIALEKQVAELLGKPAALFTPSGTMANQLAIRCHTQPGDEVLAHEDSHIIHYETGAPAALSGVMINPLRSERGFFTEHDLRAAVRAPGIHSPASRLVVIENTHNRGGGSVWPVDQLAGVCKTAHELGLSRHLDGARLWNACAATGLSPREIAGHFDTVSVCFSKGLGAPVGSALCGEKDLIDRARRFRKMFGGGMRQSGLLAAAAGHALTHHRERLREDHEHAQILADAVGRSASLRLALPRETNMVFFDVMNPALDAAAFCAALLKHHAIAALPMGTHRVRLVTHLHISAADARRAAEAITRLAGE